jgi:hypothetical protein
MQLGVDSKLVAHGLLMWIAWILLLPAAIGALRFAVFLSMPTHACGDAILFQPKLRGFGVDGA